ncbi:3-hydroxyacyl-CoA dehydrogenase family protein [Salinadaptatus halalkaliphilus]|uniref:L-gulonate 3-dehydrogenase n=1 Tax=Salinadaptatus halalkaliphilus TaxID=2419781 RepID=A0A4S3TQN1_9EURY|nr:3-hydroxyacyl-CoA dehydrogenase NAD-binding domain-containing protein [Salinadaptatus halalkaliphilus]THE65613.1 3-hydroxyacyl-CoA dehydrogenase family protein [Salinadaptatus halalkaliphilus]
MTDPIDAAVVVGAGTMGVGLAMQFARAGVSVTLVDHRQANLDRADEELATVTDFLEANDLLGEPTAALERIETTLDLEAAVETERFVLETISEDLEAKRRLFERIVAAGTESTILATNTSSLRITDIAAGLSDGAARVVGCHWWNPPYLLPVVEVIPGTDTAEWVVDATAAFVQRVDRDPILVNKDVPGFVWNRIQFAVLRECLHIVESGIAAVEDVERAVRDGYATRTAVVGPFETVDISGLELFERIAAELNPELSTASDPSDLYEQHRQQGRDGVSAGAGFLRYDADRSSVLEARDERLVEIRRALGSDDPNDGS